MHNKYRATLMVLIIAVCMGSVMSVIQYVSIMSELAAIRQAIDRAQENTVNTNSVTIERGESFAEQIEEMRNRIEEKQNGM